MARKRKFAKSIQQEGISRDQISERFKAFGWVPNPTNIDLGEDFIVHIYIDGNPTGKTFHLQAKSVTNIDERRKKNFLVYKLRKQDIVDWEQFEDPVALLIWDIKQRTGKWALLEDVILYLDKTNSEWRKNRSVVNVYIPWLNSTDDKGLLWLQERVAVTMLPTLLNKKDFSIRIKDEDQELNQKLQFLSISGGKLEISGANLVFPTWFSKWFDLENFQVAIESKLPVEPIFIKVSASDLDGTTHFHEAELIMINRGTNSVISSNDHKNPAIRFVLTITDNADKTTSTFNLEVSVNNFGKTVYENRDLFKFVRAFITSGGGKIFISTLGQEPHLLERENTRGKFPEELEPFLEIIETLCKLQDHAREIIIYPERGITPEEQKIISIMKHIIEHGMITGKMERFEIDIKKPGVVLLIDKIGSEKRITLGMDDETKFRLFEKDISLGRTVRYVEGQLEYTKEEIQNRINNMEEEDVIHVVLKEPRYTDYYPDLLIKEAKRVGKLLNMEFKNKKNILFGELIWERIVIPNQEIQMAILTSPDQDLDGMLNFCKKISLYPIKLYKFEDLELGIQSKVMDTGEVL